LKKVNPKIKYSVLLLATLALLLLIYNKYNLLTVSSFDPVELKYAKVFFGIGILCAGLYFLKKSWRSLLSKIMIGAFGICSILSFYLFVQVYEVVQKQNHISKYYELENCEQMENQFAIDLKKDKLQYFHFGLGSVIGMEDIMKSNYNIEYHSMGCLVRSEMNCYNRLVNEYLKENFNKSMSDIQKETNFYQLIETE
tara:strand:- start:776 stop:1366 length:591 start_codon:yes stop_codon:yes gene_type:complete